MPILPTHQNRDSITSDATLAASHKQEQAYSAPPGPMMVPTRQTKVPWWFIMVELANTAALIVIAVAAGIMCWFLLKAGEGV